MSEVHTINAFRSKIDELKALKDQLRRQKEIYSRRLNALGHEAAQLGMNVEHLRGIVTNAHHEIERESRAYLNSLYC